MSDSMIPLFVVQKQLSLYMIFLLLFLGFNHFIFDAKVYKTFESKKKLMPCPLFLHSISNCILCHILFYVALLKSELWVVCRRGISLKSHGKTITLGLKVLVLRMFLATLSSSSSLVIGWLVWQLVCWSVG
jgi:hypothetical protein